MITFDGKYPGNSKLCLQTVVNAQAGVESKQSTFLHEENNSLKSDSKRNYAAMFATSSYVIILMIIRLKKCMYLKYVHSPQLDLFLRCLPSYCRASEESSLCY